MERWHRRFRGWRCCFVPRGGCCKGKICLGGCWACSGWFCPQELPAARRVMPEGGLGSRRDARCSPGPEASRGEQWAPRLDALCSPMTGSLAPALCSWQGRWDAGCIHDRLAGLLLESRASAGPNTAPAMLCAGVPAPGELLSVSLGLGDVADQGLRAVSLRLEGLGLEVTAFPCWHSWFPAWGRQQRLCRGDALAQAMPTTTALTSEVSRRAARAAAQGRAVGLPG